MDVNQLAAEAKSGDSEAMYALWGAVRRLCYTIGDRYLSYLKRQGVEREDFEQELFLALYQSVKAFDPDTGKKFTSYLNYPIQSRFRKILGCQHGEAIPPAPESIYKPIKEDITIEDMLKDDSAGEPFLEAENSVYTVGLHEDIERCLAQLEPRTADVIRRRYYGGGTLKQVGEQIGVNAERVRQIEGAGFRKLKRMPRMIAYKEDIVSNKAYHGTGYRTWKYSGSSVQERTVEWLEDNGIL